MQYPIRAGDVIDFTPDALKEMDNAPNFKLRWATREDRRRADIEAAVRGIVYNSADDFRAEILRDLKANASQEEYTRDEPQIIEYWEAADAHNEMVAKLEEEASAHAKEEPDKPQKNKIPEFEHPHKAAFDAIEEQVTKNSAKYRVMAKQNEGYHYAMCEVWLCVLLSGFTGLDMKFRREGGIMPEDDLDILQKAIAEFIGDDVGKWANAYVELALKANSMKSLPEQQRKNSSSPLPLAVTTEAGEGPSLAEKKPSGSSPASTDQSSVDTPPT